ncbi:MAG: helix-turn-helix domain-containing protein [Prevotella sp.]
MDQTRQYSVGDCVDFKVKSVFGNYCELQDGQTVTYLQNTGNMRLVKGRTLHCKILSVSGPHPKVELLDYSDIDHKEKMIDDKVLTDILKEMGVAWSVRDFIKLVLTDDNDLSFDRHCHQWIQNLIEKQQDLCTIKSDCKNILEMSGLLDSSSLTEREMYQERLTTIIELLGYYILAKDMLADRPDEPERNAQEFIDSLLVRLKKSGYVYHPRKAFNILSSLFVLTPSLMSGNIERMFSVIKERDISQWKKEPFRTALLQVLELYVAGNEREIDKTKDNTMLLYNTIQALSIQLLLHDANAGDTDIIDYRLNASRLCTLVSYASMSNQIEIVNLALYNLVSSRYELPAYNLDTVGCDRFNFFVSNKAASVKEKIDTISTFTHNNVRLTVSDSGITLGSTAGNVRGVLPSRLSLWNNLQIMLDSKLENDDDLPKKGIERYKTLWTDIERDLFESGMSENNARTTKKSRKLYDRVEVSVIRQDTADPKKFYCTIEDGSGDEAYIYIEDIVPYNVQSPSVRHFISEKGNRLVFEAIISEIEDGEYHISMSDYVKAWAETYYYDDEDIICFVAKNQTRNSGFLPGVTTEGISVTIKGLEDISGLKAGDVITARLMGSSSGSFHIEAKAGSLASQFFNLNESFHILMEDFAIREKTPAAGGAEADVDTDRILDTSYVRQLIYIIDRIATLDNDDNEYIKAYNYLGFARMLSLLIGWEEQAAYYKGRMDIILMLHYFAINDRIDEESVIQMESMNADLFSSNVVLQNRFRQLQLVSYIGKAEHNGDLWEATNDADESVSELASLVLSYNFMSATNMYSQATDVQNRIKETLRLKGYESGLKLYGTGIEDKTTEYKTSIVYLADKTVDVPNMQEQMKVILAVINSFLNTDGGTLYIGVNDSGMGVGLESDLSYKEFKGDRDEYARSITDAVVEAFGKVVATLVDVRFDPDNEKPVCIVKVSPYKDGVQYNGMWYVRIGSTKRSLSKAEFNHYNTTERVFTTHTKPAAAPTPTPPSAPAEVRGEGGEPSREPKPVTVTATAPVENIPTSEIRFNVYEEYDPEFRPTIAYLQFLDKGKFRKVTEYNWEPGLLTLAVYDEDADGYLVLAYDNGYVAKVPMDEILRFDDRTTYSRYSDANLIFASIAHDDDALMSVTEEGKGAAGRTMLRIDSLTGIEEAKLGDYGGRFYNEGLARRVIQIDIIPCEMKDIFVNVLDKDKRSLGLPARTISDDIKLGLQKAGITLRLE